jgi:eukaryotic-like serine/threonine-protein kinase
MVAAAQPETARYEAILKLAQGGMGTVYVGAARGAFGFRQLVAIKRPHPHLFERAEFRREFLAEARLASQIHHANVVDVRDVEVQGTSISLIMDYIEGASVGDILVAASRGLCAITPGVAVRIALDALSGLHAAHELVNETGQPLCLVHRDISPQNILVGVDGVSRVTDFGVAKFARQNGHSTQDGALKGKLAYMAPEYLRGERIDRRFDVFAVGVVLWEMLTGRRLFRGEHEADTMNKVLNHAPEPVAIKLGVAGEALDEVLAVALNKDRTHRFDSAFAMARALESAAGRAGLIVGYTDVAQLVRLAVGSDLDERRGLIRAKLASEPQVPSSALDRIGTPQDGVPTVSEPPAMKGVSDTVVAPRGVFLPLDTLRMSAVPLPVAALPASTLPSGGAEAPKLPSPSPAPSNPVFAASTTSDYHLPKKASFPVVLAAVLGVAAVAGALVAVLVVKGSGSGERTTAQPSATVSQAPSTAAALAAPNLPASVATGTGTTSALPASAVPTAKPASTPVTPLPRGTVKLPPPPASVAPAKSAAPGPPPNPYN